MLPEEAGMVIDLSQYRSAVFFTGAGISAESGVATYRGAGGIWGSYRWQDYACQQAFERNPDAVLDFHERRRAHVLSCAPNAAHRHLAALQRSHAGVAVVTQNTDGLHQRAGSTNVVELHGSLWRLRCSRHGVTNDDSAAEYGRRHCPACGGRLRPDITWFEDRVAADVFARAEQLVREASLFVAVGTSALVWPAAGLVPKARAAGALLVELNPEPTDMSPLFDHHLRGPAGRLLPAHFPLPAA